MDHSRKAGRRITASAYPTPPAGSQERRRHSRRGSRDDARARARSRRRFHASDGDGPPRGDDGGGGSIWPGPRMPRVGEAHLEWPYWLILIVPWLMLGSAWLLDHLGVCFMCLPDNIPLP